MKMFNIDVDWLIGFECIVENVAIANYEQIIHFSQCFQRSKPTEVWKGRFYEVNGKPSFDPNPFPHRAHMLLMAIKVRFP